MNSLFLENYISSIKDQIIKTHITNVVVLNSNTFILSLYNSNNKKLFISLEKNHPYINLLEIENVPTTLDNGLSQKLRHFIRDGFIYDVKVLNEDAIVELVIRQKIEEYNYVDYRLIIELINKEPCLLVLAEDGSIKISTYYQKEGDRVLLINEKYQLPNKNKNFVHSMTDTNKYNQEFNHIYESALIKRREEKYAPLLKFLRSRIKTQTRKLSKLKKDIEEGEKLKEYQDYGNLPYYMDLKDVHSQLKEAQLKFDDTLKPNDLAQFMFSMAKKGKRKVDFAKEQLAKTNNDLIINKYQLFVAENSNEEELDELTIEILGNNYNSKKKHNTKNAKEPYKVQIDNCEYYFGVNKIQNNTLTFHRSNPDEIFMHIKNYPGSHIIIKKANPSDKELINGAMLALTLSNELAGEVDYCPVKYVKSTEQTGLVTISHNKVIKINSIDEKIKNALNSRQKIK